MQTKKWKEVKFPEEYDDLCHKFITSLSDQQKHDYYKLDNLEFSIRRAEELSMIEYILNLVNPEE